MNMKSKELRLKIELVPSTSWYDNLRKYTTKEDWDKVRKAAYANYGYRCGICGTEGRLNCHEIWEYDDKKYIQKLKGFIALCDMCHHVKHIGLAGILASEGKLDYEKVIEHFMKVNKCDRTIFERHKEKAFEQWEKRSSHEWQVDLGEYDNIIKSKSKSSSNHGENIKLKDAVELYKQEERSPSNSYEWYRKSAQQYGRVSIGDTDVPAYKQRGIWYLDDKKFAEAIKRHREAIKHLKQVTADYAKGIIYGKDGDVVYTEWGGYEIRGGFRFVWSDYERARMRSDGTWYCNRCNIPAETEHDKEECHLCRDWNGCGRDCTLSKVYCPKCGESLDV